MFSPTNANIIHIFCSFPWRRYVCLPKYCILLYIWYLRTKCLLCLRKDCHFLCKPWAIVCYYSVKLVVTISLPFFLGVRKIWRKTHHAVWIMTGENLGLQKKARMTDRVFFTQNNSLMVCVTWYRVNIFIWKKTCFTSFQI